MNEVFKTCFACNGTGKILREGMHGGEYVGTCIQCNGKGKVLDKEATLKLKLSHVEQLLEQNVLVPREIVAMLISSGLRITPKRAEDAVLKELRECYFRKEEI